MKFSYLLLTIISFSANAWEHEDYYSSKICLNTFEGTSGFIVKTLNPNKHFGYTRHIIDCETKDKSIEFDWFNKSLAPDECLGQANRYASITGKQATCYLMSKISIDQYRYTIYKNAAKRANVILYIKQINP